MQYIFVLFYLVCSSLVVSAKEVNFNTNDSATIYAELQKRGSHAVLLAHGAIFNKESWGEFEQQLLDNNYTVLAIDFRGYGKSTLGKQSNALHLDILAGVQFLQSLPDINEVSVLGASMGGAYTADHEHPYCSIVNTSLVHALGFVILPLSVHDQSNLTVFFA